MTISISCIETIRHHEAVKAIESTLKCVNISKIYWFSNLKFPKDVGCEVVNIKINQFDKAKNFNDAYSHLTLELIPQVVETDYNLIVQYDGYAVNKKAWRNSFLNYDYIGAVVLWFPSKQRVGNGGFCLRSKKLYQAMKDINIKYQMKDLIKYKNFDRLYNVEAYTDRFVGKSVAEDFILSCVYRGQLEKEYGVKFAPEKIANRFCIESNFSSSWLYKSFGFHGSHLQKLHNSVFYSILQEGKNKSCDSF